MKDQYNRIIDYLRISITDKCNLRCQYCMPEEGMAYIPHQNILRFEEITRLVEIFTGMGVRKLKITGGEPFVRRGVEDLIPMLYEIQGIDQLTITTNGIKDDLLLSLSKYFSGINISLDTLDQDKYKEITRYGELHHPLRALEKLLEQGHKNVKINMVPIRGFNEDELIDFAYIAKESPLKIRFIELMPIGCGKDFQGLSENEILTTLNSEFGEPIPMAYRSNGPATYFTYPGFQGALGFIRGVDHHFCHQCNRVRLTAEGFLKTCLGFSKGIDLGNLIKNGAKDWEIEKAIEKALQEKPLENQFDNFIVEGKEIKNMNQIGG
ncbi:MAG: GTP 3',8-cyclase MoaA [Tissierellia bacterium]|nr:GTP 3',8-cyclase MoaA [Tissierellia bacterium]